MPKINPTNMLPAGTLLEGRYRIERYLSSGGCGNTYLAKDTKFSGKKGRVVVKEFFLNGITHRDQHTSRVIVSNQDNAALFEKLRRKFRDEADRINELKHPNIVRVSDVFDANHTSYYVMDFISGGSLNERAGQLSEQQAVKYVRQVLQALDVVHEEGLYHLDLKPANVMLDKYDNAILIDFGASKMIGGPDGNTLSSTILYTKGYAPAEQMYRDLELIGPWTDLYAVGATLYNLLTGKEPPSPSVLGMKKESAFVGLDEADPGVRAFVFHCMQSDISKRPHSVAEALYELNHTNPSDRCLAPEVIEINPDEDSAPDTPADPNDEPVPQPLFSLDESKDDSVPLVQGEPIDPAEEPEEAESIVVPEEAESIPVAPIAPTPRQPKPQQPAPKPEDAPDSGASHGGTFGPSENSDNSDNSEYSDYYSDSEIVTNPNERPKPAPQPAAPIAPQEKGKSNRLLLLSVLAGMVMVIGGILAFRSCGGEATYSLDESEAADSTTLDTAAVDPAAEPADTLANETPVAPAPSAAPEPLGAAPSNAGRQTTTTPATSSNRSQSTRQTGTASTNSSLSQANSGSNAYSSSNNTNNNRTSSNTSTASTSGVRPQSNTSTASTSTARPQSNTSNASTSSGRSSSRQTLDFRSSGASSTSSQGNASSSSGNSNSNRRTMDFR